VRKRSGNAAGTAAFALAVLLAMLCLFRTASVALEIPLNSDEEGGITGSLDTSVPALLLGSGLDDQINVSPLHYLQDKAWLAAFGGWARELNPNLLLRIPALLFFSIYVGIFSFVAYLWAQAIPLPVFLRLAFVAQAGLLLQTNHWLFYGVALRNRPYALWFLLTALQLLFLTRALKKTPGQLNMPLAAVGALLSLNSYAAATQAAAVLAARWLGRPPTASPRFALLEAAPSLAVGFFYFLRRNYQYLPWDTGYLGLWADALITALRIPGISPIELSMGQQPWQLAGAWGLLPLLAFLVLPLLAFWRPLREHYTYALAFLLFGVPVTGAAILFGGYLASRYFYYLFPALAALQILSVLALAARLGRWRQEAGWAVVAGWVALIGAYRAPPLLTELSEMRRHRGEIPLWITPSKDCPSGIGQVRMAPINQVHTARFAELCGFTRRGNL
jgi:hypothetical protein